METLLGQFWELIVVGTILYVARKWLGEKLYNFATKSERRQAIWNHYVNDGHSGEVTSCYSGKCATL